MKNISRVATAALGLGLAALSAPSKAEEGAGFEPCYLSGLKEKVKCTSFDVPLDYANPESGTITVHATIVPALSSNPAEDPFFVFAGGPGQAAGDYGMLVRLAFDPIRTKRDIVLLDQRGTGRSSGVRCDGDQLPETLEEMSAIAAQCRENAPMDVRFITMENVVRDAEEVRAHLGYPALNLWGGSYGTRTWRFTCAAILNAYAASL
ncbi:alpha/beta fold hydrolase [Kordiimonas gwangyangensis]|uniref:alpha/beta fold hydrolase n=1 Tax=Kordiimonas gwangyangensis TaxID=288022 RepID=UPI00046E65B0|nr:alpha/beta fold hydrolase [Kordiimonas gwangyangensis]